jgi:hypothetical protein
VFLRRLLFRRALKKRNRRAQGERPLGIPRLRPANGTLTSPWLNLGPGVKGTHPKGWQHRPPCPARAARPAFFALSPRRARGDRSENPSCPLGERRGPQGELVPPEIASPAGDHRASAEARAMGDSLCNFLSGVREKVNRSPILLKNQPFMMQRSNKGGLSPYSVPMHCTCAAFFIPGHFPAGKPITRQQSPTGF